ncbi:MAG TPA: CoA transferase [Bacteriovoracaceae bacterium]|nr:CoA transferase [Bacteriovoracaceae bacterium]
MLKGYTFIDLTHRLPGPLAGKILADLGATVIKIEDEKHKDPFLSGMFSSFDQSFENWYEELNRKKQIVRLDFKSPEAKKTIRSYLEKSQGALLSLSPKLKATLGLADEDLKSLPLAVVELEASSTHNKAMHDLNALALSGYLSLHVAHETAPIVDPPFMPIAGIAFGQQVATQMLANVIYSRDHKSFIKSVSYLHDTAEAIFHPFWSKELQSKKKTKFLHNGAYPCYSLYRLIDGHYLAVAAVEEKFWTDFTQTFSIPLPLERRFETTPEAFNAVALTIAKLNANEIETRAQNKELCISIVRKVH